MKTALLVVEVILGLIVIVSILMQPSKSDALSGLVQGSKNETFYAKNKSKNKGSNVRKINSYFNGSFCSYYFSIKHNINKIN